MPNGTLSRRLLLGAMLSAVPGLARAQTSLLNKAQGFLKGALDNGAASGTGSSLSQGEIGAGLKDALSVASRLVVSRVGKTDGYNGDPAIRIPLPAPLQKLEGVLDTVGAGGMLSDLQVRMNRAAEQAAPKALDIFAHAISGMSIDDARKILSGPQDAATQYFRTHTSDAIRSSFRPIVDNTLSQVGAVNAYKTVQSRAGAIPMLGQKAQSFDLTDFTVDKALDGLFHYMSVEEKNIRTNPAARTTDLLKKVFG